MEAHWPASEPSEFVRRDDTGSSAMRAGRRYTFVVGEDGRPAWDEMRADGLGKIQEALAADPEAAANLGLPASAEPEVAPIVVTEEHTRFLWRAVGDLQIAYVVKGSRGALTHGELEPILQYEEKELEVLAPLTANQLNRFIPAQFAKYKELGLLCSAMYEIHQHKFLLLKEYLEAKARTTHGLSAVS